MDLLIESFLLRLTTFLGWKSKLLPCMQLLFFLPSLVALPKIKFLMPASI